MLRDSLLTPRQRRQRRRQMWMRRNLPATVGEWLLAIVVVVVGLAVLVLFVLFCYLLILLMLAGINYLQSNT